MEVKAADESFILTEDSRINSILAQKEDSSTEGIDSSLSESSPSDEENAPDDVINPSDFFAPELPDDDTDKPIFDQIKSDLSFKPRLMTGVMQYKYAEKSKDPLNSPDVKWRDNMPFWGIGGVVGYKDFSLDAYFQQSVTGKSGLFEVGDVLRQDHNTDLKRTDYAVSLAYRIDPLIDNFFDSKIGNLSLYGGYKVGDTDIRGLRRRTFPLPTGGLGEFLKLEETKFETKGPTLGMAYGWPIGSNILGINFGYAWLQTSYSSTEQTVIPDSTSGYTVKIIWKGRLSTNLNYSLSLDGYKYTMTAKSVPEELVENINSSLDSIEESVMSFKASLNFTFW